MYIFSINYQTLDLRDEFCQHHKLQTICKNQTNNISRCDADNNDIVYFYTPDTQNSATKVNYLFQLLNKPKHHLECANL